MSWEAPWRQCWPRARALRRRRESATIRLTAIDAVEEVEFEDGAFEVEFADGGELDLEGSDGEFLKFFYNNDFDVDSNTDVDTETDVDGFDVDTDADVDTDTDVGTGSSDSVDID